MDGVVAYILGKSYTKKSLIGIGALAGAPCQVQSINKVGKTTTITLKWEDNLGGVHTQAFDIEDGADGVSVTNATIDTNGHLILTLSNGTTLDSGKVLPQYNTLPTPSASNVGQILQYVGATNINYTKGYFYECVEYPVGSGTYIWQYINVQDSYTKAQIGDLTLLPDNSKNVVENIVNIQLEINQLQGSLLKKEDIFRYNTLPTPSSDIDGAIIQYIGATNVNYTNGYFYQCVESPIGSGTYIWVQKNVQPSGGSTGGDGVVDGYYNSLDQLFYYDNLFTNPIIGEDNTLYVDLPTNGIYRYDGLIFIQVLGDSYTKAQIGDLTNLPDPSKDVVENIDLLHGSMVGLQGSVLNIKNDVTNLQGSVLNIKTDISNLQGSLAGIDKNKLDNLAPIYLIGSGLTLDTTIGSPTYGKLQATGMSIPIDDKLDASSLNPVQNKVITLTIDQLQGSVLKKIQKKLGITFIFVTHDQEEALTMSDKIIVMNKGKIQQMGTPQDIYNEPENSFVAKFIGESNIFDGVMLEDFKVKFCDRVFDCVDKGFDNNEEVEIVIRPEDVKMVNVDNGMLKGKVTSVVFKGVHYEIEVKENDRVWIIHSTQNAQVGSELGLDIYPEDIHIMRKVRD